MDIEICKWHNNADSPALLFIDDLANLWVDTNGNGKIDLGEDWGYAQNGENSSFRFLNEIILKDFPKVKSTFFVPVGVRVGVIEHPKIKSISKIINCDEKTKQFFKDINDSFKYEIAYHGTIHGKVGKVAKDFKQEWELFNSLDQAIDTIKYGKEIYKDVFGKYPKGGKYCGYLANEFSDDSIDNTGFLWWCRCYNTEIKRSNSIADFNIKTFGKNKVIDIPTTLMGNFLTGVLEPNLKTLKGIVKNLLKRYLMNTKIHRLNYLLKNESVISIQEHISPARDDGKRQIPNIFDDRESLYCLFNYLKDKNIWYCTATELAEYYWLREHVEIESIGNKEFIITHKGRRELQNKKLTIKFKDKNIKKIKLPDLSIIEIIGEYFNIDVLDGVYKII